MKVETFILFSLQMGELQLRGSESFPRVTRGRLGFKPMIEIPGFFQGTVLSQHQESVSGHESMTYKGI